MGKERGEGAGAGVLLATLLLESLVVCEDAAVSNKLKTASSVCCGAAPAWLSTAPSTPTHQPRRFGAQICRNHNCRRAPALPPCSPLPLPLPPVSGSLVAEEVAYLCSCQSAASSSAGAPASPALLSPSPAWLS